MSKKKSFSDIMRSLHRDLGYFVIGLTLIYAITGFILSGRDLGWMEQTYIYEQNLSQNISKDEFIKKLKKTMKNTEIVTDIHPAIMKYSIKKIKSFEFKKEEENILYFKYKANIIKYNKISGDMIFEIHSYPGFLKKFITAHKSKQKDVWFYLAIMYSIILSFLAISAMFMVKGKYSFPRRGVFIMLSGIALVIAFLYFF
ncbi:MAG: hypothetical protein HRT40_02715 [Campylobacteraceae bacterium]|nr:hypothetical protein [Campylobacteraceae bacterium]